MKKPTLYFILMPQLLFFLACNAACIRDQNRIHFDLSALRSKDLIKLAENIEPNPNVSLEGIGNIPYPVLSPDGKRVAKVEKLRSGIESQVYVLSVSATGEASGIKIAEVVNFFGLCWSPGGSKIAFSEGTMVHIADSDGQTKSTIYSGPGGPYPGASFDLRWSDDGRQLSFLQVENAQDPELANPSFVTITLGIK
jgi:Tol biopolymer transport system component